MTDQHGGPACTGPPAHLKIKRFLHFWSPCVEGVLILDARSHRTQERNRQDALNRLDHLIQQAMEEPVPRRPPVLPVRVECAAWRPRAIGPTSRKDDAGCQAVTGEQAGGELAQTLSRQTCVPFAPGGTRSRRLVRLDICVVLAWRTHRRHRGKGP